MSDRDRTVAEIEELRAQIRRHDHLYYVAAQPEITDREYDLLMRRLQELEAAWPDLATPDSPTRRLGDAPAEGFTQVRHTAPMLSLANAYSREELREFDRRIRELYRENPEYVCELKIDGVAVTQRYREHRLELGATRGDGAVGDDITSNLRTIRSIPLMVNGLLPVEFEVRGEVYYPRLEFERMNRERAAAGLKTFMNPRNGAAGTLKLLDSREVAKRPLRFFAYAISGDLLPVRTQAEVLTLLKESHFPTNPNWMFCRDLVEVEAFLDRWNRERFELPYDTDGVVVKLNDLAGQIELGATAKSPRWALAYKFETQIASTRLNGVTWQVGRTGVLTPVAELEPVLLLGTWVKRATLHNPDEIARLGILIGDMVEIEKGGEIIPKVIRPLEDQRSPEAQPIEIPKCCPVCHTALISDPDEVGVKCPSWDCPAQVKGRIAHFASRGAMDIEGLGYKNVELFVDNKLIRDAGDLYSLQPSQIEALPRQAETSAENLIRGIDVSKSRTFDRVMFGLGIRHVGIGVARKIAAKFTDFEALDRASEEELMQIEEVGPVVAASISEFFAFKPNLRIIEKLKRAGIPARQTGGGVIPQTLAGKTFVLTGTLEGFSREQASEAIRTRGGQVTSSVSKKTDYLVVGADPGSKLVRAQQLGVVILNGPVFIELLDK